MKIPQININQFDYELSQERIAKYPLDNRDLSRLLIYKDGEISEKEFFYLPDVIPSGSAMVFNNSRVICARLMFQKETGANIEIFCLEPFSPIEYQQNLQNTESVTWKCLIGNKKKWKTGCLKKNIIVSNTEIELSATYEETDRDGTVTTFTWNNATISFGEILDAAGSIPIPPYLMRESEDIDSYRYQTIYSTIKGSVAAPTAGLHFTPRIFENLEIKDVEYIQMTLHVGAGTFKPVQTTNISDHLMHEETFTIALDQLRFVRKNLGHTIAVGTTSTRLLESLYFMGVNCIKKKNDFQFIEQWDPYLLKEDIQVEEALDALILYFEKQDISELTGKTSIMIVPGYQFKIIKGLVTNFHQPKSTLLLLIAALIGDDWKKVYDYALNNDFRFLSYGDGSVLLPKR